MARGVPEICTKKRKGGLKTMFLTNNIITDVFTWLSDIIAGVIGIFVDLLSDNGLIQIFFTTEEGLSFVGVLALIALGFGLTRWAFAYVRRLISMRG